MRQAAKNQIEKFEDNARNLETIEESGLRSESDDGRNLSP